uniref:Uncharacterized protein n=1 Tax=Eutreptiella gymnastica TaxID=73025 RepID=A0A7S4GF31_9EUGL
MQLCHPHFAAGSVDNLWCAPWESDGSFPGAVELFLRQVFMYRPCCRFERYLSVTDATIMCVQWSGGACHCAWALFKGVCHCLGHMKGALCCDLWVLVACRSAIPSCSTPTKISQLLHLITKRGMIVMYA